MREPAVPHLQIAGGELCWMIDWRAYFQCRQISWDLHPFGDLPGFHVVFTIEILQTGMLRFWCDDGCIIRRRGSIIHSDTRAHSAECAEISVQVGDVLEIAQWQLEGEWFWGAWICTAAHRTADPVERLLPYLSAVEHRLSRPTGPPVKMYTSGTSPLRAVTALYSLILNGYSPSSVHLYGEHQWPALSRDIFARSLPFASVVPTAEVLQRIQRIPAAPLAASARSWWFIMKACVGLFCPPYDACLIDDDVFVVDSLEDALRAWSSAELVYGPDQDLESDYVGIWGALFGCSRPLATRRFNAGLYWIRNLPDASMLASRAMRARINPVRPYSWEQGLIAAAYAARPVHELPVRRYLFALFTGLPGGVLGYDYENNPCGFASIHFAGMLHKASDADAIAIAPKLLKRKSALALAV